MIRILLADEHEEVRARLAGRLRREADFLLVCETGAVDDLPVCAAAHQPDVVILDPPLRHPAVRPALQQVRAESDAAVIILTSVVDTYLQLELQKLGVARILTKDIDSAELVREIRAAAGSRPA
jgi:DNA-binding NarL/FixJ family response regulator